MTNVIGSNFLQPLEISSYKSLAATRRQHNHARAGRKAKKISLFLIFFYLCIKDFVCIFGV